MIIRGNAPSVVGHAARFAGPPWSNNGWGILAIAYGGYAGSTGSPTEDGLLADGDADGGGGPPPSSALEGNSTDGTNLM